MTDVLIWLLMASLCLHIVQWLYGRHLDHVLDRENQRLERLQAHE